MVSPLAQVAGLIGGPGLFPGVNVGEGVAVFEQGARHVAKDIAGQGVANPSAGLLAAAMMLRHLNLPGFSDRRAPPQVRKECHCAESCLQALCYPIEPMRKATPAPAALLCQQCL